MAQSGFTPILLYASNTASSTPSAGNLTNSANGAELAVNTADKRLFTKDSGGAVVELGTNPSTFSLPNQTANGVLYLNGSKVATSGSALTFDGTNLTVPAEVYRTSDTSFLRLSGGNGAGTGANVLMFGSTHATNPNRLSLNAPNATATSYIDFGVAGAEQMRLTSTGLGIGTSSPAAKLHVESSTVAVGRFQGGAGAGNGAYAGFYGQGAFAGYVGTQSGIVGSGTSNNLALFAASTNSITLWTNGTQNATLDSSGNLGIGTSSPGYRLDVVGVGKASSAFAVGDSSGNLSGTFTNESDVSKSVTFNADPANVGASSFMRWNVDGTERMRLDSSGNLGIGTSSPTQKLHVKQDQAAYTWGRVDNQSSSASAYSGWMLGAFGNSWGIAIGSSAANSNALSFVIDAGGANTERMRLDASGNLGLGVTPSAWGDIRPVEFAGAGFIGANGSGTGLWSGQNTYYNGANWIYKTTAAATYTVQAAGVYSWFTAPSGTAGNTISFTQAMTLDASGNLLVGGTSVYAATMTSYGSASRSAGLGLRNSAGTAAGGIFTGAAGSGSGSTDVYVEAAGFLAFNAGGSTERARITSGGDLLVGTTTNTEGAKLNVQNGYVFVKESGGGDIYIRSGVGAGVDPAIQVASNDPLLFYTNNTERARITSGGDLLVGTTSGAFTGKVVALQATSASDVITAWNSATTGDNSLIGFFTDGGIGRGSIDYNRAGGLVRYNTTSDYRAKDILGPVQDPGATIDALKVYEGVMKGATQSRPMLIAHEAQAHAPYAVSGVKDEVNEDGTPKFQQIDVSSLVPLLLAEIQSLRARVAVLEGV